MSLRSGFQKPLTIKSVKFQAAKLSKNQGISRPKALDIISKENGFSDYRDLKVNLSKSYDISKQKVALFDFVEGLQSPEQIEGFSLDGINIKFLFLDFFNESYATVNSLRGHLHKEISNLSKGYEDSIMINFSVCLSHESFALIKNKESFFDDFVHRHSKLFHIEFCVFDSSPTMTEIEDILSRKHADYQEIWELAQNHVLGD